MFKRVAGGRWQVAGGSPYLLLVTCYLPQNHKLIACVIVFLMACFMVACSRDEPATPTAVPTITVTIAPTRTLAPTRTPAPEPTATPILPSLSIASQTVDENGRITITAVTATEPGWVVVHAVRNGEVAEVLGFTAVAVGNSQDVTVQIDPLQATDTLAAVLHVDKGFAGEFEFPGADVPITGGNGSVSGEFAIELEVTLPSINVTDQEVLDDGLVQIASVVALADGWLLLHADEGGNVGEVLGFTAVQTGENNNLVVSIPWRGATPTLHAMLYEDNGRSQLLDYLVEDLPVLVQGQPVLTSFHVTLPPDVFIYDQPVVSGTITIERVISNGPGWVSVLYEEDGQPGLIIGFAALQDGLNEQVVVELEESAVTNQLFIQLHQDLEPFDEFDYPRSDPTLIYQGRAVAPFAFRINPGNYLFTQDQPAIENSIVVPLAVVESAGWVVIYNDDEGQLGDVVGHAPLNAGINRDVVVEVDQEQTTPMLYAALHLDAGTAGQFEYPDGPDVPFQRNLTVIQSPFALLAVQENE